MKKALSLGLVLALSLGAARADDHPAFTTHYSRGNPGLQLAEVEDSQWQSKAVWHGPISVTGKLIILFNGDRSTPDKDDVGYAVFAPDRKSRKRLPTAINRFPCPVLWAWLLPSPAELMLPLLGKEGTEQITQGTANRYEIKVKLETDTLRTERYFFLKGNGRTYFFDTPTLTADHAKVYVHPTRAPAPGQELPYCQ